MRHDHGSHSQRSGEGQPSSHAAEERPAEPAQHHFRSDPLTGGSLKSSRSRADEEPADREDDSRAYQDDDSGYGGEEDFRPRSEGQANWPRVRLGVSLMIISLFVMIGAIVVLAIGM